MNIKIINLERSLPYSVCITAHWIASKDDGCYTASSYGSIRLPEKDPSDPAFVSYKEITEAQAVEWVKSAMGEEALDALEAGLDAQIEAQKNPVIAKGVPWESEARIEALEG